jgi:hypothetical protein
MASAEAFHSERSGIKTVSGTLGTNGCDDKVSLVERDVDFVERWPSKV